MAERRKYRNPPVIEALCELYFARSQGWDDTTPGEFYRYFRERFPTRTKRSVPKVDVVAPGGGPSVEVRGAQPRMHFVSAPGDSILQLERDLVIINQLTPYKPYHERVPLILEAAQRYCDIVGSAGVTKIGMRYINRVSLPGPTVKMEAYFKIYPQLPEGMGNQHGPFMVRVMVPARGDHAVIVTISSAPPLQPKTLGYALDLYDVYQCPAPVTGNELSDHIALAHDNVIDAFEGSITNELRRRFEEEVIA